MRTWFRRNKRGADPHRPGRKQAKQEKAQPQGTRRLPEPPAGDPIKNWETPDQAFLRQAGDPFDG